MQKTLLIELADKLTDIANSLKAIAAVSPKVVQAVMRHSTITLTFDTYGHLMPSDTADAIEKLSQVLCGEICDKE